MQGRKIMEVCGVEFEDVSASDTAWVGVRIIDQKIGIALSLRNDGDMEVLFSTDICKRIIKGLEQALAIVDDTPLPPSGAVPETT
jgi:hypothetical protein